MTVSVSVPVTVSVSVAGGGAVGRAPSPPFLSLVGFSLSPRAAGAFGILGARECGALPRVRLHANATLPRAEPA